jgi:hypothetical protein
LAVQPDGHQRDVVLRPPVHQSLEDLVQEFLEREAGELDEGVPEADEAGVEVGVPPLDEAVGVEQHRRATVEGTTDSRRWASGSTPRRRSPLHEASSATLPSGLTTSGGRWPAFAQRIRVIPRSLSSGVCSKRATAAVASVLVSSVVIDASRPRRTSAGPPSL